ncbi:MAG: exodeoxyribonuclease V subunit alpha [Burkholderia sp.]|nr:exodeoxyribonuclease V subunit alpha [Burkholderia sp.]
MLDTTLLSDNDQNLFLTKRIDIETALMEGFSRRIKELAYHITGAPSNVLLWVTRAAFEISQATKIGHVCISLELFAQRYNESLLNVRTALMKSGVVTFYLSGSYDTDKPLVVDLDNRLYLARYFDYEYRFAHSLVAHMSSLCLSDKYSTTSELETLRCHIIRYFGPDDLEINKDTNIVDWQRVAVITAMTQPVTIISGGPGTGKTTTVVRILACLLHTQKDLRIALAAPTGKAAQRMQEAIYNDSVNMPTWLVERFPETSYTLHRLLGGTLAEGFHYHHDNPLPYEVIFVDEASMIDIALAYHLIDAIGIGSKLILLGDKDQLTSINAGSVFSELCTSRLFSASARARIAQVFRINEDFLTEELTESIKQLSVNNNGNIYKANEDVLSSPLSDCVVWLDKNYRFDLDSSISRLSLAIRRGAAHEALDILLSKSDTSVTLYEDVGDKLLPRTIRRLAQYFSAYIKVLRRVLLFANPDPIPLFNVLNCFRILCVTRTGSRGSENVNSLITLHVRRAVRDISDVVYLDWFPGRIVMMTRNSYEFGVFNGDIGIVLPDTRGILHVWFKRANGTLCTILPEMLPLHEAAFALTVHKSQGSEFDDVTLILPARFSQILTCKLIYTAVTRARRHVQIISDQNILAKAIMTDTARDSGLASRVNEAFKAKFYANH